MADPTVDEVRRACSRPDEDVPIRGFSRRRFLQGVLATGGLATAHSWLLDAASALADPLGAADGIVVTIQMSGGNDGLNTVVPFADPTYAARRPHIGLAPGTLHPVGAGVGLHPSLAQLKTRFDLGQVAIVRGVGYPSPDLSHFTSMANWMSGTVNADPSTSTGWLGRYMDGLKPNVIQAVTIGSSVPLHLVGRNTKGTALPTSLGNVFGLDRSRASDARMYDAVSSFGAGSTGLGAWGDAVAGTEMTTMGLSAQVSGAYKVPLPGGNLSAQLTLCARLINANLGIRVFSAEIGGFDTHADELAGQATGLSQLDAGIQAFFAALDPAWATRVALMTFSEFGRRVEDNNSGGTDHGTASDLFVVGARVAGGLYGAQPSLTQLDRSANLVTNVDFRSVYATVLNKWLAGDATAILGGSFAELPLFAGLPGTGTAGSGTGGAGGSGGGPGGGGTGGGATSPPAQSAGPPVPSAPPTNVAVMAPSPPTGGHGYVLITANGGVFSFGRGGSYSVPPGRTPIVGGAATPTKQGVWLARADGTVHAIGDAPALGDLSRVRLVAPIKGVSATPSGKGFWLVAGDGGAFAFGDAPFLGSTGAVKLHAPVVGLAATPSGRGYWVVAADGGVFNFGDASFHGSAGGRPLKAPVIAIASTPTGNGYWLVASDGGVFAFGDARFVGSTGALSLNAPIQAFSPTPSGQGYWFAAADGGVFTFGDASFQGSLGAAPPTAAVVALVA